MRPRGSLISQLLVAFCVFAVLTGVAAAAVYVAVARQNTADDQVGGQYTVLQQANSALEFEFGTAEFAVFYYQMTGQRAYLLDFAPAKAAFERQLAVLQHHAIPSVRGLVARQASTSAAWFALAPQLVAAKPGTNVAAALLARSLRFADGFAIATTTMQGRLYGGAVELTTSSKQALSTGLAWSAVALAVAVLLVLAASLSTVYSITRPLRGITATVRKLTTGDYSARAPVTGSAEVREVAESVNAQADESDRLRAQEAESNRLRALAREHSLAIREHLVAADVLSAGRTAVEQILDTDVVYLRLIENGELGAVIGRTPRWLLPADVIRELVPSPMLDDLRELFRAQTSMTIDDVQGAGGDRIPPGIRETLRDAGVAAQLLTPFGVGNQMLGIIVAQRMEAGRRWTPAEVYAMESVTAEIGRSLNRTRIMEAESRLVEDLKALDRAKSSFFATVSHELRAPLTTIEGYVEMFNDGEGGEVTPQQRQMLETIDRSTVRLRNLVEDLFTLAKLESGAFTTVMRPVDLTEVISAAAEAVRPSVLAGELTLTLSNASDLMVDGDASQLDRVMINLLSNAVKFTPKGGRIEVASCADGETAVIRVTDTGIGVPGSDQKELFSRFFRASNATGRSIPGTGLGLAIVRMIVVNHGGDIDLESREGAGTTVTIRLPVLALDSQPTAVDATARPPVALGS
jgi:two-component system, OmpR family, phosphate regulon sensor histidine kinase PhoR